MTAVQDGTVVLMLMTGGVGLWGALHKDPVSSTSRVVSWLVLGGSVLSIMAQYGDTGLAFIT